MLTFSDIRARLNQPNTQELYTSDYTSVHEGDRMAQLYNNIWGAATDTRMFKDHNGDRVITGTLFGSEERFYHLMYSRMIGGTLVDCKPGTGCNNLAEWLRGLGYTIVVIKDKTHPLGVHAHVMPLTQIEQYSKIPADISTANANSAY